MSDPAFGIYLHWPYCTRICPYCDFNVRRARGQNAQELLDAFDLDLRGHAGLIGKRQVDTVFFGGGTPSLLKGRDIAHVLRTIDDAFGLAPEAEISLEANPEDHKRFTDHAAAGINRFSLGVQALDDAALVALGRNHDTAAALRAIEAAARTDRRVSIDLIYAREGQSIASWARELRTALTLPVEHLSLYQLTIEDGTAFAKSVARGTLSPPAIEIAAALYEATQELSADAGFPAYEISNHARGAAAQSRHNLLYWRGQDWLGIGPGAHARFRLGGERMSAAAERAPKDYLAQVEAQALGWKESVPLTDEEARDEALLMGLRLTEGLERARLGAAQPPVATLQRLSDEGLLIVTPERLTLTPRARLLADRIAAELAV